MKKTFFAILLAVLMISAAVSAQDYRATAEFLEEQIRIMQLQATLDAIQNQNGGGNAIELQLPSATPAPQGGIGLPISKWNFPLSARPPYPYGPAPVWNIPASRYTTDLTVGDSGQYKTLSEAVQHIPSNAGNVTIRMFSDTEEPQAGVSVPIGRGITSLRITSDSSAGRTVWPRDRSVWFFCNGIPLIIDRTVTFSKMTMIMGGYVTYAGHSVEAPESTIIIDGKAYWVYAGGQSDREGYSSTVNKALVIVNGEADRVYAGGRAIYGETIVRDATVIVNGTANEVYCSGFTEYASAKATVGRANMLIYGRYGTYGLGRGDGDITLQDPAGCLY